MNTETRVTSRRFPARELQKHARTKRYVSSSSAAAKRQSRGWRARRGPARARVGAQQEAVADVQPQQRGRHAQRRRGRRRHPPGALHLPGAQRAGRAGRQVAGCTENTRHAPACCCCCCRRCCPRGCCCSAAARRGATCRRRSRLAGAAHARQLPTRQRPQRLHRRARPRHSCTTVVCRLTQRCCTAAYRVAPCRRDVVKRASLSPHSTSNVFFPSSMALANALGALGFSASVGCTAGLRGCSSRPVAAPPSPATAEVRIRFTKLGRNKVPFFRVVAMDSAARRDGRPLEARVGEEGLVTQPALTQRPRRRSSWAGTTRCATKRSWTRRPSASGWTWARSPLIR